MSVSVTDVVLGRLDSRLAAPDPEQGGALLRPVNGRAVTTFIWDETADTSSVSYVPSAELIRDVGDAETSLDLTLVGVVHSHPNGMNRLSGPDLAVTRHLLQRNRHLGWVVMPIVTQLGGEVPLDGHEVALPHGRVSWFCARLDTEDRLHLAVPATVRVLPVGQLVEDAAELLHTVDHGIDDVVIDGTATFGLWFRLDDPDVTVWVLVSHDFPLAAPLIALDDGDGLTPVSLPVLPSTNSDQAIRSILDALTTLRSTFTGTTAIGTDSHEEVPS